MRREGLQGLVISKLVGPSLRRLPARLTAPYVKPLWLSSHRATIFLTWELCSQNVFNSLRTKVYPRSILVHRTIYLRRGAFLLNSAPLLFPNTEMTMLHPPHSEVSESKTGCKRDSWYAKQIMRQWTSRNRGEEIEQ